MHPIQRSIYLATIAVLGAGFFLKAQAAESAGACPFLSSATKNGIPDDGCAQADKEPPQYPGMLDRYANRRPPFNVAGVDYHVGVPAGVALKDPAADALPDGCSIQSGLLTCAKDNTVVSGYDFSLHEVRIYIPAGVSGTIITNNKFSIGPACKDPLVDIRNAGSTTLSHNSFDGAGALCPNLLFGTLIFSVYPAGAISTVEYNEFTNIPSDGLQYAGPPLGAASIIIRNNLFYIQGFAGHPDGFQANGGNFGPIDISFNTYYNAVPPSKLGAQPLHVEAQLTSSLDRSTVSHNTIITLGDCNGGHGRCAANTDIACKQDSGSNKNTNFSAYGNYIDSSGALGALHDSSGCSRTNWGIPFPNRDLKTGAVIPAPAGTRPH